MGQITIELRGSFKSKGTYTTSALAGGHAAAIGRAIEHLVKMLPGAIEADHQLHGRGEVPPNAPFGREAECEHGVDMTDYCEPCARINGGSG